MGDVYRSGCGAELILRVVTLNCNGIRSVLRKDNFAFLTSLMPDIVCLQETKAQSFSLPLEIGPLATFHSAFVDAVRPGYSGVAIMSRRQPDRIVRGMGDEAFDGEGRYVQMDFGNCSVVSVYAPSGTSGDVRQAVKNRFMTVFERKLATMAKSGRDVIICGDFNVAHREIDVHDPRSCSRFSGFLAHERVWIDRLFTDYGWIDALRAVDSSPERYTWWTYRAGAFQRNKGWRIDYQLASPTLVGRITDAIIFPEPRLSDHAALCVDYDLAWDV